jgi:hypothetical protein
MEYLGKQSRQANRDTVISAHSLGDIKTMRKILTFSRLMVRVNPWGEWSVKEIDEVLTAGADIVMLPYFTKSAEVKAFISHVRGRARTCLLLETLSAIEVLDEILAISGIDFIHIGLNDIHIERETNFMFEFLADGGVDRIAAKLNDANISFGFGGMARIGHLTPPAERILAEHFRLGSTGVILSRSFCHPSQAKGTKSFEKMFLKEMAKIREQEMLLAQQDSSFFELNRLKVIEEVGLVVGQIKMNRK